MPEIGDDVGVCNGGQFSVQRNGREGLPGVGHQRPMQSNFCGAGVWHQRQLGARQKQAQVAVGGQQPAARIALQMRKAAGRPKVLHGKLIQSPFARHTDAKDLAFCHTDKRSSDSASRKSDSRFDLAMV